MLLGLVIAAVFALFLFATARLARRKGRNAWTWTLFTAAFPALFLVLLVMRPLGDGAAKAA